MRVRFRGIEHNIWNFEFLTWYLGQGGDLCKAYSRGYPHALGTLGRPGRSGEGFGNFGGTSVENADERGFGIGETRNCLFFRTWPAEMLGGTRPHWDLRCFSIIVLKLGTNSQLKSLDVEDGKERNSATTCKKLPVIGKKSYGAIYPEASSVGSKIFLGFRSQRLIVRGVSDGQQSAVKRA
jgi:hypothetical protein